MASVDQRWWCFGRKRGYSDPLVFEKPPRAITYNARLDERHQPELAYPFGLQTRQGRQRSGSTSSILSRLSLGKSTKEGMVRAKSVQVMGSHWYDRYSPTQRKFEKERKKEVLMQDYYGCDRDVWLRDD